MELEVLDGENGLRAAEVVGPVHSSATRVAWLRLLWRERRLLARAAGTGLAASVLLAFLVPSRYQSTAQLMPPDERSSSGMALLASLSGKMGGALGSLSSEVLGLKSSGALFVGILTSRTVEDDLIRKHDLRNVYGVRTWERARRTLAANTAVSEDRKSGIITISVTDRSPQRAAELAGAYVAELNARVNQLSVSSARRERVFLEGRLAQVKQDLEAAEREFSEFSSQNGAIDIKEQGRAMVSAAATLQGQLIAAQSELEGLKQIYTENNVRVRSLRARVAVLRSQLEKLGGKSEIGSDLTNPAEGSLYPSIRKLPLLGVPYADLYRRTQVQEAVFETLTQEYELAKVAEAKEIPSVKILDVPEVPETKSFPPRLLMVVLGGLLSSAGALLWVSGQSRWQEVDAADPHKLLLQDVLRAVHPHMPWAVANGSRWPAAAHRVWMRLARGRLNEGHGAETTS